MLSNVTQYVNQGDDLRVVVMLVYTSSTV